MPQIIIEIRGLKELQSKLEALEPRQYMTNVMGECLEEIRVDIARAPAPSHSPVIWASDKQRRWWFAARRKDELSPRYTRESDPWSGRLLDRWTTRVEQDGLQGVVGSAVPYGPFVQDESMQTAQHKATGWRTIQEVAKSQSSKVIGRIQEAVRKILRS